MEWPSDIKMHKEWEPLLVLFLSKSPIGIFTAWDNRYLGSPDINEGIRIMAINF